MLSRYHALLSSLDQAEVKTLQNSWQPKFMPINNLNINAYWS